MEMLAKLIPTVQQIHTYAYLNKWIALVSHFLDGSLSFVLILQTLKKKKYPILI